ARYPQPELLLLDEPAAGIDFHHEKPFYELIAELNRKTGVTVVLVSHELSVISEHVHHVLCLNDGRVQCEGPPQSMGEMLAQTFGEQRACIRTIIIRTRRRTDSSVLASSSPFFGRFLFIGRPGASPL